MATEIATSVTPTQNERLKIFLHALLFVAGFSLFIVDGWFHTVLGRFVTYKDLSLAWRHVVIILIGNSK
jgi:cytochrome c biogenesis protein CcdA